MYNVLPLILKYLTEIKKDQFSVKDIAELSDLSEVSIRNNITRLVNAGYFTKLEYRDPHKPGKIVRYQIGPHAIDIIKGVLY